MHIFPGSSEVPKHALTSKKNLNHLLLKTFHRKNAGSINFLTGKSIAFPLTSFPLVAGLLLLKWFSDQNNLLRVNKKVKTMRTGFPSIRCHYLRLITFFLKQIERLRWKCLPSAEQWNAQTRLGRDETIRKVLALSRNRNRARTPSCATPLCSVISPCSAEISKMFDFCRCPSMPSY